MGMGNPNGVISLQLDMRLRAMDWVRRFVLRGSCRQQLRWSYTIDGRSWTGFPDGQHSTAVMEISMEVDYGREFIKRYRTPHGR